MEFKKGDVVTWSSSGRWQLEDENWCDYGSVGMQKTNALHRKS